MPRPYSDHLREKVLNAADRGMSKSEAGRVFSIHRKTIETWMKRREATGRYSAKRNYQQGNNHGITDWEEFRRFLQAHGEKTQAQMAEVWGNGISERTISRALKKIGLTCKKRPMAIKNKMNSSAKTFLNS